MHTSHSHFGFILLAAFCLIAPAVAVGRTTATATIEKLTTQALIAGDVPGVKFDYDVAYLPPDRSEKLDVYLPVDRASSVRSPAIVVIHGGGWSGGIKDARRELQLGVTFARAGYVAVSVEYLRERNSPWPQNIFDCKNAVRWIRANAERLQVDPDRIGVIGGSAGGHLALMVGYTAGVEELSSEELYPGVRDDVQAVVNLYGITDLEVERIRSRPGRSPGRPWGFALLNDEQQKDRRQWKLGAPIEHVTSATVPTMILHGDEDLTVDVEHAQILAEKLEDAGVPHEVQILPGAPHSFLLHDQRISRDLRPDVLKFFETHLK